MKPTLEIVRSESPANDSNFSNSPASLRAELRERIERFDALDARHRIAREIHERAEKALSEAAKAVEAEKVDQDTRVRHTTVEAAKLFAEALRAGSPLPPMAAPAAADNALLGLALSRRDALELSARELAADRVKVAEEAASAAGAVDEIVDKIIDAEGRELAAEVISTIQAHWAALDRLTGLLRIDERRQSPRLRELQEEVVQQIDRRKLGISRNPLMVELHNWRSHLEGISADAERIWTGYQERLRRDPDAQLDVE